jgi:hypothetical protein
MFSDAALTLALKLVSPILIGFITPFALDGIKQMSAVIDGLPAYAKQGLAIAIASLATGMASVLGTDIPTDLAMWDGEVVKALVAGFLAIAIKQHKQLKAKRSV